MTPAERAAVHTMAGAFGRLSLAAELASLDAGQLPALERVRKLTLRDFAAAQDALAGSRVHLSEDDAPNDAANAEFPPPKTSSAAPPPPEPPRRAAQTLATSANPRDCPPGAGGGRAVPKPGTAAAKALELAAKQPFSIGQLARFAACSEQGARIACLGLIKRGLMRRRVAMGPRDGRLGATLYELVTQPPRSDDAPAPQRAPVVHPPRGRTAKQELAAAEAFLADKPALPPARPVACAERGALRRYL